MVVSEVYFIEMALCMNQIMNISVVVGGWRGRQQKSSGLHSPLKCSHLLSHFNSGSSEENLSTSEDCTPVKNPTGGSITKKSHVSSPVSSVVAFPIKCWNMRIHILYLSFFSNVFFIRIIQYHHLQLRTQSRGAYNRQYQFYCHFSFAEV